MRILLNMLKTTINYHKWQPVTTVWQLLKLPVSEFLEFTKTNVRCREQYVGVRVNDLLGCIPVRHLWRPKFLQKLSCAKMQSLKVSRMPFTLRNVSQLEFCKENRPIRTCQEHVPRVDKTINCKIRRWKDTQQLKILTRLQLLTNI